MVLGYISVILKYYTDYFELFGDSKCILENNLIHVILFYFIGGMEKVWKNCHQCKPKTLQATEFMPFVLLFITYTVIPFPINPPGMSPKNTLRKQAHHNKNANKENNFQ